MMRCGMLAIALALGGCPTSKTTTTTDKLVKPKPSGTEWIPVGLTKSVVGETYDFTVVDTAGRTITSRHLRGKVIIIDFWATWCPPCRTAIPHLKKLYDQHHDKGLEIVGISMDNHLSDLDRFVKREGISWPQVWGSTVNECIDKADILGIPTYLVIGRDGRLVKKDHVLSPSLIRELMGNDS